MRLQFRGTTGIGAATVIAAPNNPAIAYSDYAGALSVTPLAASAVRPIVDGNGFEYATPGMRGRVLVALDAPGQVIINLRYSGLITRVDTYNDVGSIYVNGVHRGDYSCPVTKGPTDDHPESPVSPSVILGAGTSLLEWVYPYCASLETTSLAVPIGAGIAAPPARPSKRYVVFGDSRVHGFNATRQLESWTHKLGVTKNAEVLNLGYGGRQIVASDGTLAGSYGAAGAVYLAGFNDFYPNGANTSTIQAAYQAVITNYRAAATAAGYSTSKLVMLSDLWAETDVGIGPYRFNSPTLQAFRNAMQAAVTAVADPYCVFLSGNTGGMPTGSDDFIDGVHPIDVASTTIAGQVAAVMP